MHAFYYLTSRVLCIICAAECSICVASVRFILVLYVNLLHYITIDSISISNVRWLISSGASLSGQWSFWHGCLSAVMHCTCSCQTFDWSTTNSPRLWLFGRRRVPLHELLTSINRALLIARQPSTNLMAIIGPATAVNRGIWQRPNVDKVSK